MGVHPKVPHVMMTLTCLNKIREYFFNLKKMAAYTLLDCLVSKTFNNGVFKIFKQTLQLDIDNKKTLAVFQVRKIGCHQVKVGRKFVGSPSGADA